MLFPINEKNLDVNALNIRCESILKTLPLAYYLKTNTIKVEFDKTSDTSYFNPQEYEIHVASKNIIDIIARSVVNNDYELENVIRNFLYHEVSHAILTPTNLMKDLYDYYAVSPSITNILEDARIEYILKDYYLDVNFENNIKTLCPLNKDVKTLEHFIFNVARLNWSPYKPQECKKIIDSFLSHTSKCNCYQNYSLLFNQVLNAYDELKRLFDEYMQAKQQQEQNKQNNQNQNGSGQKSNSNSNSIENSNENNEDSNENEDENESENENQENNNEDDEENEEELEENTSEDSEEENEEDTSEIEIESGSFKPKKSLDKSDIENLFDNAIDKLNRIAQQSGGLSRYKENDIKYSGYDKELKIKLLKLLQKKYGVGINKAPVMFGTSGKFNAKRYIKDFDNSCKWFAKKTDENTGVKDNKCEKRVINIWLDNSTSYENNDYQTNRIINTLIEIENACKDFEFNLIRWGQGFHLMRKGERVCDSMWGTTYDEKEITETYAKVNPTQKEFNIFLQDGGARQYESNPLKVFNNKRTVFIVDREVIDDNRLDIMCPNAKEIIVVSGNTYCCLLKDNIAKSFELLFA